MATSMPIRIAAVLGASFAAIAVVAGTRVLAGIDVPDYVVHRWLVWYNVVAGAIGVAIGVGLWLVRPSAIAAAWALAAAHGGVLIAIAGWRAAGGAVANASLVTMTLRTLVWSAVALVARRAARPRV